MSDFDQQIVLSYQSKGAGGKAFEYTERIANELKQQGLTCFHGKDITAGKDWRQEFFSRIPTAKVALVMLCPDYPKSGPCRKELVSICKHLKDTNIIPVCIEPTNLSGNFFGDQPDDVRDAALVKSFLGNQIPPPEEGVFQDNWSRNFNKPSQIVHERVKYEHDFQDAYRTKLRASSRQRTVDATKDHDMVISYDEAGANASAFRTVQRMAQHLQTQGISCYHGDNSRKDWKETFFPQLRSAKGAIVLLSPSYMQSNECRTELVKIYNRLHDRDVHIVCIELTQLQGNFFGECPNQVKDAAYVSMFMGDTMPTTGIFQDDTIANQIPKRSLPRQTFSDDNH